MPKFDKGFSDKLDQIGKKQSDRSVTAPVDSGPVDYKKVTFHNRSDLQDRLHEAIDKIAYEKRVRLSQAVLIRYALTTLLENLDSDPDALLNSLAQFEQIEVAMSSDRYQVNRGLQEYIQR